MAADTDTRLAEIRAELARLGQLGMTAAVIRAWRAESLSQQRETAPGPELAS